MLVATQNVVGRPVGRPVELKGGRRRLATVARRHAPAGRKFLLSVHRAGEPVALDDHNVRLRKDWSTTLVGPKDVVLITLLPLGGGSSSQGGGGGGKGIGLAIASIALIAFAPYAAGALGLTGTAATAVQVGLTVGGIALAAAAQKASAAKKKAKEDQLQTISGGGNAPRPGDRKPLIYGRCWTSPPLSQADFFSYDGDVQVYTKRVTLGLGKFNVHTIRVGQATFWSEAGGVQAPFNDTAGYGSTSEVEVLYEQPSAIAPGDVISSTDVSGQELPRFNGNPSTTPWFPASPPGVAVDSLQIDYQWPYGVNATRTKDSRSIDGFGSVQFFAQQVDLQTGAPVGGEFLIVNDNVQANQTKAIRRTAIVPVGNARYRVRGVNTQTFLPGGEGTTQGTENRASWDGLRGLINDTRVRPGTTEIVIRLRLGVSTGLSIPSLSDVEVDASRIIKLWRSNAWSEGVSAKCWDCYNDLIAQEFGLFDPGSIDKDKTVAYLARTDLAGHDEFNGQLDSVNSFWEAASQILNPLRAEPVKVGALHTWVRDESSALPRHVLTRRQIVKDSGGSSYTFATKDGTGGDVIVEFNWDGDPRRPDEVRYSYGPRSRTPKRYRVPGITTGGHALHHATWLALVAVFRGAKRKITTEWDGRLVYPGDHILSDLWFHKGKVAVGVAQWDETSNVVTLDADVDLPSPDYTFVSVRSRRGREWGILRARRGAAGGRAMEFHAGDLDQVTTQTGLGMFDVFAGDAQDPTTIVIGELVELQETYVAQSAVPRDRDFIDIDMVRDDTRVWQILGETVQNVPSPDGTGTGGGGDIPLVPFIPALRAQCQRIETGIEVIWSAATARGAVVYDFQISYDQVHYEDLALQTPSPSGKAAMRQSDDPVTVRGRAYGRTGIPGEWVYTTFTTIAPSVEGAYINNLLVEADQLAAQVRLDIANISRVGSETIRGALKDIQDQIDALAASAADEATTAYESRLFARAVAKGVQAALLEEVQLRADETSALAQKTTALTASLTDATTGQLVTGSLVEQLKVAIGLDNLGLPTVKASKIDALSTTVGQNTAAITTTQSSVNGIAAQYGVAITINGTTGGFVLSGAKKLDGTTTVTMGITADLIVGKITASQINVVALSDVSSALGTQNSGVLSFVGAGSRLEMWD